VRAVAPRHGGMPVVADQVPLRAVPLLAGRPAAQIALRPVPGRVDVAGQHEAVDARFVLAWRSSSRSFAEQSGQVGSCLEVGSEVG
jgi:hypothetical protein